MREAKDGIRTQKWKLLSCVWLFTIVWTVACQAPLSMGFWQEYWLLLLLLSRFSRVRLCNPRDSSPPGSPVPGILQARTMEYYLIIKRSETFIYTTKWMTLKEHEAEWKYCILYDFICMQFWERQNCSYKTQIRGDWKGTRGRDWVHKGSWEPFLLIKIFCILIVVVVTWLYIITKVNRTVSLT